MLQMIKHTAFRIWAAGLLGGAACLLAVSLFPAGIAQTPALLMACATWVVFFFFVGFLMNALGLFLVNRLIAEAAAWERAGGAAAARQTYGRAVALFDGFLMSPTGIRKKAASLLSGMARFYLASGVREKDAEIYIIAYLKQHPEDREAAENWLRQMVGQEEITGEHQSLAGVIGDAQAGSPAVQKMLARIYLSARRYDFQALQTYRRVLDRADADDATTRGLSRLFLEQRRVDEWALQVYLKDLDGRSEQIGHNALAGKEEDRRLLQGIAACLERVPRTGENRQLLQAGRDRLEGLGEDAVAQMSELFCPAAAGPSEGAKSRPGSYFRRSARRLVDIISVPVRSAISRGRDRTRQFLVRVQRFVSMKKIFKWVVSVALLLVIAILVVNTVNHLMKTRTRVTRITAPVSQAVIHEPADRFTIQVAAYQKPEYAKRFVARLKKQDIDAFWTEAAGAKRKWYQVRISHFPDKQSARSYGEKLKSFGIIDDFYVANYEQNPY